MPAVIFSGTEVKALKDQLDLNGTAKVRTGTDDPTSVAQEGPKGSLYLRVGGSGGTVYVKQDAGTTTNWQIIAGGVTDHGALTGLSDDDHTQYALLAGRSAGQTVAGGTGASEALTLNSTAHATKGKILLGANSAYDENNKFLGLNTAAPNARLQAKANGTSISVAALFDMQDSAGNSVFYNGPLSAFAGGASTTDCAFVVQKDSTSSRSINAAGTVNASGADYAEYMEKANPDEVIQKGEVCGVNAEGKLTKKFAEAIQFVIKSTDPSYVGGDKWGADLPLAKIEEERKKYDRIAFCGQVPCKVVSYFKPGDWVVPVPGPDGSIMPIAVPDAEISFEDYKKSVGRIWKDIGESELGLALVAVGIK